MYSISELLLTKHFKIENIYVANGFTSEMLIPFKLTQAMTQQMPNSRFQSLDLDFGHDGFLIEVEKLTKSISSFLGTVKK